MSKKARLQKKQNGSESGVTYFGLSVIRNLWLILRSWWSSLWVSCLPSAPRLDWPIVHLFGLVLELLFELVPGVGRFLGLEKRVS